jgi:cytochrome c biogenesis protein CcdA
MPYKLLADLVVVTHFAFIVFALLGGLLGLRWRWAPWVHIPAVLWGGFVEVTGRVCPLTPLENRLRQAEGASGYSEGFIEHYLLPIIYPSGLTPKVQFVLAAILVLSNATIYVLVWRRKFRRGRS